MRELELISRIDFFPSWIPYSLFFCVILLALLKINSDLTFINIRTAFYTPLDNVLFTKDETRYFKAPNLLLSANFIITSSIAVYMILIYYNLEFYWFILFPTAYAVMQSVFLYFAGVISGNPKKLKYNFILTSLTSHFIGLLLLPLLFIWILNPQYSLYIINIIFISFATLHILRIIRGVFLAFRNKVLWYYIILYLCTFEIGPIFVLIELKRLYFIG